MYFVLSPNIYLHYSHDILKLTSGDSTILDLTYQLPTMIGNISAWSQIPCLANLPCMTSLFSFPLGKYHYT